MDATQEQKAAKLQNQYNKFQELIALDEQQLLAVASLLDEHVVVERTLTAIDPEQRGGRGCFKMVGGVLVKKLVDEVLGMLHKDITSLEAGKTTLSKNLRDHRQQREKWISESNVKVMKQ